MKGELAGRLLAVSGCTISVIVAAVMLASAFGVSGEWLRPLRDTWGNPVVQVSAAAVVVLWVAGKARA